MPADHGNGSQNAVNACAVEASAGPGALEAPEVAHDVNNEKDDEQRNHGSSGSLIDFGDRPKSKVRTLSILIIMDVHKLYSGPTAFRRNAHTHRDSQSNFSRVTFVLYFCLCLASTSKSSQSSTKM